MPMWPHKLGWAALTFAGLLSAGVSIGAETPDLPPPAEAGPQTQPQIQAPRPPMNTPSHQVAGPSEPQSFLDAQSETERRRLLDKQQRTFQLEVDGKYAKALKAYCDTGYGDERCFRPEAAKPVTVVAPAPAPAVSSSQGAASAQKGHPLAEPKELPAVAQISGFGEELSAILVFGSGRRLRVFAPGPHGPRSVLPDGEAVVSIRPGEVLVSRSGEGKPVPLLFQSSLPNFSASE